MQISSSTSSPYAGLTDTPARRDPAPDAAQQDAQADASSSDDAASSAKQFACGALGLDSPDAPSSETNGFYTAGKWVAAAVTVGKIVSLFV
ncbi:hypothetical protein [Caballeronia sp. ATUFL_M2_KS44]|uniref:hypothetical protein n=1 Tax=Caballeronia sp. ATUFL_M2_KS44 TaxID=2921767 RepID=UPI0020293C1B|nr:hypothetical protein [Caballeronia sp. ATUFL_M2_KS44]